MQLTFETNVHVDFNEHIKLKNKMQYDLMVIIRHNQFIETGVQVHNLAVY